MLPALLPIILWYSVAAQQPAPWLHGWTNALERVDHTHIHVVVFSDSTGRVDQTNGIGFGPDHRENLWPERLQSALQNDLPLQSRSRGLLTLEANAARFDTDVWSVSGHYDFNASIGPCEAGLDDGQVPFNGSTVSLHAGEKATLSPQSGDALWIYWAACPESHPFSVAVDEKTVGNFGQRSALKCTAKRTRVYRGPSAEHELTITAGSGNAYIYAAEWTNGKGGVAVDNFSIGGATSDFFAGPSKLTYVDLVPNVALAVIALGVNDFLHSIPPDRYRSNLKIIIGGIRMRFPAASILIVSQYRVLNDEHHNLLGLPQSAYIESARGVATAESVGYLDLSQRWGSVGAAASNGLLTKDLVHPSDAGGRKIACEIERVILLS